MAYHDDLLKQAHLLATLDPRRPKQANVRRSISSSYYALFHLLGEEYALAVASGSDHRMTRFRVRRVIEHVAVKAASRDALRRVGSLVEMTIGELPSVHLKTVATEFVWLQDARFTADYDLSVSVPRQRALDAMFRADRAISSWNRIRRSSEARVFLLSFTGLKGMSR